MTETEIETRGLLGIAIDLSASMQESIRNNQNDQRNRLESIRRSLKRLTKEVPNLLREEVSDELEDNIDLIVYGFGFRDFAVCDLLSLLETGPNIIAQLKKTIDEAASYYPGDPYNEMEVAARMFGRGDWTAQNFRHFFSHKEVEKILPIFYLFHREPEIAHEIIQEIVAKLPNFVPPIQEEEIATTNLVSSQKSGTDQLVDSGPMEDDTASKNTTSSEHSDADYPPQVSHYQLVNLGQERSDESPSADLPRNVEMIPNLHSDRQLVLPSKARGRMRKTIALIASWYKSTSQVTKSLGLGLIRKLFGNSQVANKVLSDATNTVKDISLQSSKVDIVSMAIHP